MSKEAIFRHKQQQKIKNRLYNIDFEDVQAHQLTFKHYYELNKPQLSQNKNSEIHELSDWSSNAKINVPSQSTRYSKLEGQPTSQKDSKRFTFLNTRSYKSSLLSSDNKKNRLQLSPIVVKFNAKILSQNLQRSMQKTVCKMNQDPYLTQYNSMRLLAKRRKKSLEGKHPNQIERYEMKFEGSDRSQQSKDKRMTTLLRLIKRQSSFKMRPRAKANPEDMILTQYK